MAVPDHPLGAPKRRGGSAVLTTREPAGPQCQPTHARKISPDFKSHQPLLGPSRAQGDATTKLWVRKKTTPPPTLRNSEQEPSEQCRKDILVRKPDKHTAKI